MYPLINQNLNTCYALEIYNKVCNSFHLLSEETIKQTSKLEHDCSDLRFKLLNEKYFFLECKIFAEKVPHQIYSPHMLFQICVRPLDIPIKGPLTGGGGA